MTRRYFILNLENVTRAVLDFLNSWDEKPAVFRFSEFDGDTPALMIDTASTVKTVRKYVDGGGIYQFPFSVYIRIRPDDSDSATVAIDTLNKIASFMKTSLPFISEDTVALEIAITALPHRKSSYRDGTEDYRADFSLAFRSDKFPYSNPEVLN